MSADSGGYTSAQYQQAMDALGLLTATFHDGHSLGLITKGYVKSVTNDGVMSIEDAYANAISLAFGMTALARLLVVMREDDTGKTWEETLAEVGRYQQEFFSSAGE